jgi:glycosyltransferase involved in cell wall biosynthesis
MSNPALRVLQVAAPARSGGLETVLAQLSSSLRLRGHEVQVALVLTPGAEAGHPLVAMLEQAGVPVHALTIGARQYLAERQAVAQIAAAMHADVVHTHGYRADILHGGPAQAAGRAHVMTLHGFVSGTWRDRLYEWLQLRAAGRANVVVAVSSPIVARLQATGVQGNVHLVRNAIAAPHAPLSRHEARRALKLPADVPLIGWVGRLSHEKGPDLFIEAMERTTPQVHAAVLGEGPLSENLQERVRSGVLAKRIHFCGGVVGASRYLAAFDALALSSRTEGTPMILLEAMISNVPIVAAMVGGVPDVLDNDEAWCCPPGDAPAMAVAIAQVVVRPEEAMEKAERAAARVQNDFSLDHWLNTHEQIYRDAVQAKR